MSLGFIPVIISIILCEFITQDMSIYIGAGVGLLFSIYSVRHRGTHVPQIILYCTTGMLLLLSVTTLFLVNYCPRFMLPFTLEISAIIPPFIIYLNRRKFLDYHMSQTQKCCKQLFAQGETLPATFCFMWRLPSSLYQAFCSISSAFSISI